MDPMQKHATSGISLLAWLALPIVAMLAFGAGKIPDVQRSLHAGAARKSGAAGAGIFLVFYGSWMLWSLGRALRRVGLPIPRLIS